MSSPGQPVAEYHHVSDQIELSLLEMPSFLRKAARGSDDDGAAATAFAVPQRRRTGRRGEGRRRARPRRVHPAKMCALLLSTALSLLWTAGCVLQLLRGGPAPPPAPAAGRGRGRGPGRSSLHGMHRPLEAVEQAVEAEVQEVRAFLAEELGALVALAPSAVPASAMDSPLVVFTCMRADYLRRTLEAAWRHHPANRAGGGRAPEGGVAIAYPVVISQDGGDRAVARVAREFVGRFRGAGVPAFHVVHQRKAGGTRGTGAYKALAEHFGWALERIFSGELYREEGEKAGGDPAGLPLPQRVVILEEDIEVAPDFFSYLNAMAPLLASDPSLLAVSGFNDNGGAGMVGDEKRLVRSDFFPGLGWMMPRRIWDEIGPKWPEGWWDDWLREPEQRRGRQTIRPEVSRTFHFGKKAGASWNQFGKELRDIELGEANVRWDEEDVSYLERDRFRVEYYRLVGDAKRCAWDKALEEVQKGNVRVEYDSWDLFAWYAKRLLGVMNDEKAGVPRTAFENIVETRPHGRGGHLLFIAPPEDVLRRNMGNGKTMERAAYAESIRVDS